MKKWLVFIICWIFLGCILSQWMDGQADAAGIIKVQFFNSTKNAITNTLGINFKLINTGTSSQALSNIKIRYYFTIDEVRTLNYFVDWTSVGNTNVTGTFVTMSAPNADRYLELGFTSAAGTIEPGKEVYIYARISKQDWSNFDQSNDYSFNPAAASLVDWDRVTAYISGALEWGIEPGGSIVTPSLVATPTSTPTQSTILSPTPTPTPSWVAPTPTPTMISATYPAENAVYGGGAFFENKNGGYNGSGYINFPAGGGYLEFRNVNGGAGGNVTLRFRYALGVSGSRTGTLTVNGSTGNITFNPTGSWTTWNIREVSVYLNSGTGNTIRLASTGQDLANIDELIIGTGGPVPTPSVANTPTNTPTSSIRITPSPTPTQPVMPTPTQYGDYPPIGTPVGWAAVNYLGQNGTTGGAGGQVIHVYSKAELDAAANRDDNPAIIVVHGNLTGGPAMNTNVRSNKTIVGAGSGASLNFGLYLRGSNIIIKNLNIMNGGYNPGDSEGLDAVTFAQDLHHVWVDHCTMHETMDGLVDPTRNARFVTISYCYFHTQNTACLIGGSDSDSAAKAAQNNSDKREWHYTVTVHHNYWTGINSRCPRVRFGPVHVFNNYYENLGSYAIGRGDRSNIYSEANYFYNAKNAFYAYDDSSNPGYVEDVNSLFEGNNGNTQDNPPSGSWAWNPAQYYSYYAHSASWVKANLKNYCGTGKGNP